MTIVQHGSEPWIVTLPAPKSAATLWAALSVRISAASVTWNWNTRPLALSVAVTSPVWVLTDVIPQQRAIGLA